jgi:TRAP transporter TAXI family solute receptor
MDRTAYVKHLVLICQVLFVLFSIFSCSQEKKEKPDIFTIGTGGSLGNYEATGRAIARIVNNKQETHGFQLQEKNTAGSVDNIDAIMKGEIEFGIAQADRQYQAINGLAEWKGRGPQKDLRAVFGLYTESVTLVASRDSGIKTIEDLRGKRVDIGHPHSGLRKNAIDALTAAGIDWRKDIKAYEEKPYERTRMYLHGELDAYFDTIGHPSTSMLFAVNSVPMARFIPLVNIDKLLSKYPYYSKSIISVKLYPGILNMEDVDTFGVKATFLTSANIRDDVVYAITKAIFEEFESLGEFDPILNTFRKESMLEGLTVPIHSGALRYYKEIGLQLPPSTT